MLRQLTIEFRIVENTRADAVLIQRCPPEY